MHVFPTFAVGGAQVRFAAIANHFGPAFRHVIVSLDGDLACRERLDPSLDASFPDVGATKNAMLVNAWRFRRLLRAWKPDTLVTCNWGAIEFALANLAPLARHVHVVDGFGPEERVRQIPRRIWLRRLALSRSPVVLPSRTLVKIARKAWKLPSRVIRYVPNGIDLDRFVISADLRSPADLPTFNATNPAITGPIIGTIAALRPEKNIARLLRAVAPLASARLIIVGDGPERSVLQSLAAALGIADRIHFAGHQADTPAFYARFDIFALSSDTEQMPLAVIEAMASGLSIVSTDVGDVRHMVAEPNRPFIVRQDDTALTDALSCLAADPDKRRALGCANRHKARQDFDQMAMFAAHGALWRGM